MNAAPGHQPFIKLLLTEMLVRMGLLVLAMVLAFVGSGLIDPTWVGAFCGLAVGFVVYALVMRRFNARPNPGPTA